MAPAVTAVSLDHILKDINAAPLFRPARVEASAAPGRRPANRPGARRSPAGVADTRPLGQNGRLLAQQMERTRLPLLAVVEAAKLGVAPTPEGLQSARLSATLASRRLDPIGPRPDSPLGQLARRLKGFLGPNRPLQRRESVGAALTVVVRLPRLAVVGPDPVKVSRPAAALEAAPLPSPSRTKGLGTPGLPAALVARLVDPALKARHVAALVVAPSEQPCLEARHGQEYTLDMFELHTLAVSSPIRHCN